MQQQPQRYHNLHRPTSLGERLLTQALLAWLIVISLHSFCNKEVKLHIPDAASSSKFSLARPVMLNSSILGLCTNTGGYLTNPHKARKHQIPHHNGASILIMLMVCGDIETNPGPTSMFPCGCCQLGVNWSAEAVCCDKCDIWYHTSCVSMSSQEYAEISKVEWACYACGTPDCVSFKYHAYNLSVSNRYDILARIPGDDSVFDSSSNIGSPSSFKPTAHSSPINANPNTRRSPNQDTSSASSQGSHLDNPEADTRQKPKGNNLRVAVFNANSINGKRGQLAVLCEHTEPDVLIITETKLIGDINNEQFLPKNYTAERNDRNIHGGGVMIAYRKELVVDKVKLDNPVPEFVAVRIGMQNSSTTYVAAYYRPPSDTIEKLDGLESALDQLQAKAQDNPKATLLIGGDFNTGGDVNWDNLTIRKEDPDKKGLCTRIIDIITNALLTPLHNEATRQGNVLDILCSTNPSLLKEIKTIPGISDHDGLVLADFSLKAQVTKKKPRSFPLWSKADWSSLKQSVIEFKLNFLHIFNTRTMEENWHAFEQQMKSMIKQVPHKTVGSRQNLPWMNTELKRMCKKKGRLYSKSKAKAKQSKTKGDRAWAEFQVFQKATQEALEKAHWQYLNGILTEGMESGNQKPLWRYIHSQRQDSQGVSPLKEGSQLFSDAITKAKILSKQFSSVFTIDTPETADTKLEGPSYPSIRELHVSEAGIEKLLRNLNPGKAAGPDEIPTRILKELAEELTPVITALIRQSLETGILPKQWKDAWVTPVFKKGARCEPANYRPVSLTCIICKLMEHVLCTHIRGHLDEHGILTPSNHGFRKGHSCESQLLLTTHDLLSHRDKGHQIDVGILDFSKAFDTVPHQRLLNKLRIYGIEGKVLNWIEGFLSDRRQLVLCGGVKSEYTAVTSGVPQGTVLGPLLFLLHINDLPSIVDPGTVVRLFADDALIYRVINSIQDQVTLQRDLKALEKWASTWGMVFNASKCHMMHICRSKTQTLTHFYDLCDTVLSSVASEKYLGVHLRDDLNWSDQVDHVASNAASKLGFIRRNLKGAPIACKKMAYTSLVRSGMEYASIVWDPDTKCNSDKLERIQRKAARWALSDYSPRASVTAMLKDLEWEPLQERRQNQRLVYLYKILNSRVAVPPDEMDLFYTNRPPRGKDANESQLKIMRAEYEQFKSSFSLKTTKEWNALSQTTVSADSEAIFKNRMTAPTSSSIP